MPGFAFASVGRLGLTSPPSRPLARSSLLCSAKTTASPSQVASLCRSLPDTSLAPIRFVSLSARQQAGDSPLAPGPSVYRFAVLLRLLSHEEMAVLSSSQATPLRTCPALRLRWCPLGLPYRLQDACLPAGQNRRLSPALTGLSFRTTTMPFSELNIAAYTLATPGFIHTLAGYACRFATDSVANLLWWDLSLSALTHWVTTVNFMASLSIPRL